MGLSLATVVDLRVNPRNRTGITAVLTSESVRPACLSVEFRRQSGPDLRGTLSEVDEVCVPYSEHGHGLQISSDTAPPMLDPG